LTRPINVIGKDLKTTQSESSSTSDSQPDQVVLKGGYVAKIVDQTKDGSPVYQVDFGAPTYCDDLKTPIDTKWSEQKDGSFKAGANKFASEVADEKVRIAKDKESIEWSPVISLEEADNGTALALKAQNVEAEILDADPMNENYNRNTLVWHYENGIAGISGSSKPNARNTMLSTSPLNMI
jgi:hypothetical protein